MPIPPPPTHQFTLQDMLNLRLALDQIKQPSEKLCDCIKHLDECIHTIITSFRSAVQELH